MSREHLVIGTAGHIDHGKTTLIKALTGDESVSRKLDRLPEEKARGITITLGFAHMELPSGRVASFVDVPGHERLVRTMVAGATGLDAVMLCVSASEGVMPQTREHLAILGLLGIRQGLVALTMTDLVDEEMRELARLDVEELVAGSFLEGRPIIETAAGPLRRGLPELLAAIDALPSASHSAEGPFRLPVDRAFIRRGFGTVVTGTVRSGALGDGEEVELLPAGLKARLRGVQVHGGKVSEARAGQRAALNLSGIERDDLARGMVVVRPGSLEPAQLIDATYLHLSGAPPLSHDDSVRLLIGTAEVMAAVTVLRSPDLDPDTITGEVRAPGLLQLRTEEPVVALPGDRFVVRRESPVLTLGGGEVLDPWAPRARRRDRERVVEELERLQGGDRMVFLERAGDAGLPPSQAGLRGLDASSLLGDRLLHPRRLSALVEVLERGLLDWHGQHPLAAGAPRRELHRALLSQLSERAFDHLVERGVAEGRLCLEGPRLRLSSFQIRLNADQQRAMEAMEREVKEGGMEGARAAELQARDADMVQLLLDRGRVQKVGERLLHSAALEGLEAQIRAWFAGHAELSPSDFKELTGLSRRHAIPLLEWLDARRVTARQGDLRIAAPLR